MTKDEFINKGPNRPVFKTENREKFLTNLSCVDFIYVSNIASALDSIKYIKPNYYFKGPDYKHLKKDITKKIYDEKNLVKKYGGEIIFTDSETFSSSKILNDNFDLFDKPQNQFLKKIKKKFKLDSLLIRLSELKKLKVHIIGEVIIDKYIFTNAIGKSGKRACINA